MSVKNFIAYPKSTKEFHDIKEVISKYVLPGFIPENKIFGAGDYVMTHGSCFAHNLAEALGSYNVEVFQPVSKTTVAPGWRKYLLKMFS